jgi:hypothetical protein
MTFSLVTITKMKEEKESKAARQVIETIQALMDSSIQVKVKVATIITHRFQLHQ